MKNGNFAIGLSIIGGLALGASVHGTGIRYVDDDASAGGDGLGWSTAYTHLQDALADAAVPANVVCEIRVAEGVYAPDRDNANPTGTGARAATFQLLDGVALLGGYRGGATDPDDRGFVSILSGDLAGDDSGAADDATHAENSYHVVTGSGVGATSTLDGFTITAGRANGSAPANRGGGIFIDAGGPVVNACTIIGNSASSLGAGASLIGGTATFTNSTFRENLNAPGGGGGGLYTSGGVLTVTDCLFIDNVGGSNGGGIYASSSGSSTILRTRFEGNTASTGGGFNSFKTTPTIISCAFIDNAATVKGGGARFRKIGNVYNSIFVGNSASLGGAIQGDHTSGTQQIVNCTLVGNTATTSGGAITAENNSFFPNGFTRVRSCILWQNVPSQVATVSRLTVTSSNVEGGFAGSNIDSDPMFVDPLNGDYSLQIGSPSVDACQNTSVPPDTLDLNNNGNTTEPLPVDFAGNARIVDGDGDSIETVDQGALELEPNQPPSASIVVAALITVGPEALATFEADASDPEGEALTLEWLVDGNSVCREPVDSCLAIQEFLSYGVHEITLRATDPQGAFGEETVTIPIDPTDLSVLDLEKAKIKFGNDPPKYDLKGEIGLPVGVNFAELEPFVMIGLDLGGLGVLPAPLVPVTLEASGGEGKKWKFRDDVALLGLTDVDIDWKGARFGYKDLGVELKSQIIASTESVLTFKYKMNEIGGAFSLVIDGREILVSAAGDASTSAADVGIEVEKEGKEVTLTLGFPLLETSVVELTGAVSDVVDVAEAYDASVGRFSVKGLFDDALIPDGAASGPRSLDLFFFVGSEGYPGEASLGASDLEEKSDEWKK